MSLRLVLIAAFVVFSAAPLSAQEPTPYGNPITLEQARKVIDAAEAEAKKQKWPVAIAVVGPTGHLVAFAKMDNTQIGSIEVAQDKAKSAALFKRSTKVFEDALAMGGANLRILKVPNAVPIEGGIPIIHEGKIIGAIGVSGVKANEDGQVAQAGVDVFKPKP